MKPQYIALIAATAALPLGAQATAPAAPAAVAAPAADSLLQQRTAAHPALAAIPADAEFVLSLDNLDAVVKGLGSLKVTCLPSITCTLHCSFEDAISACDTLRSGCQAFVLEEFKYESAADEGEVATNTWTFAPGTDTDAEIERMREAAKKLPESYRFSVTKNATEQFPLALPENLRAFNSISLALGGQTVSQISCLLPIFVDICMFDEIYAGSEDDCEQMKQMRRQIIGKLTAAARQIHSIGPVYLTCTPDCDDARQWVENLLLQLFHEQDGPYCKYVELNGYKGVKLTAELPDDEEEEKKELASVVNGRSICILYKTVGDTMVIGLAENPEDIRPAATPAESILATDKLAKWDASLDQPSYLSCYCSPAMANGPKIITGLVPWLVFDPERNEKRGQSQQSPEHSAFVSGVRRIAAELEKPGQVPDAKLPSFVQIRKDGPTIRLEYTGDACGYSYEPAKSLSSGVDTKAIPFYLESSPLKSPNPISLRNLIFDMRDAGLLGMSSTRDSDEEPCQKKEPMPEAYLNGFETFCGGIDGSDLICVSREGDYAYTTAVKDRNSILSAWQQIMTAMLKEAGVPAKDPGLTPEQFFAQSASVTQTGESTIITQGLYSDFLRGDIVFYGFTSLSDKVFSVSNDINLSIKMAGLDPATLPDFSGFRFGLNTSMLYRPDTGISFIELLRYVESISGHGDIKDGVGTFTLDIKPSREEKDTAVPAK